MVIALTVMIMLHCFFSIMAASDDVSDDNGSGMDVNAARFYERRIRDYEDNRTRPSSTCCDNGWIRFHESCYLIARTPQTWEKAKEHCAEMHSTLMVVDTVPEWDSIRLYAIRTQWTWVGLSYANGAAVATYDPFVEPAWVTTGGENAEVLPWLIKLMGHGHILTSNCVAYYAAPILDQGYVHWYSCLLPNYYICERNSTFTL